MKRQTGTHTSAALGVDRVVSNLKTWLMGIHHGVGADHLDAYLDEFVFRCNRRHNRAAGFASLLGLTTEVPPATASVISPSSATAKRRGRSTGQTGLGHRNPPLSNVTTRRRRKAAFGGTIEQADLDATPRRGEDRDRDDHVEGRDA